MDSILYFSFFRLLSILLRLSESSSIDWMKAIKVKIFLTFW